jgi:hypothetical protein
VLIFLRLNAFNADNVSLMFHGSSQDSVDGLAEFCERRLPRVRLRELTTQRINCIGDIKLYLKVGIWAESVELSGRAVHTPDDLRFMLAGAFS